ncbi:hypothetical protein Tco_1278454 [Tanacetum coccineum]
MRHRGGEIDQDAERDQVKNPLLKAEFLKTKESFQSNKPCKNQDSPEFREFFKINELKAQLKAKNSTINNLKKQIKNVHEKSNEDNVKHDIDLIKTINIELEHKVAKLLAENERWTPTGRIFKLAGLRWIPTRKMFIDSTTKVDSEPLNVSNKDITNPYEFNQTLNVSAGTLNLSADSNLIHTNNDVCSHQFSPRSSTTDDVCRQYFRPRSSKKRKYFKPLPNVDHPVPEVPTPVPAVSTSSSSSTTVNQDAPSTSTSQTTSEQQSSVILQEPSSEETTLQGIIPSNLHHLNQSFDTLTKLTKKDPLENVIGDPSRSVSTRSQLQKHVIWCYFDANDNPTPLGGKLSG